MKTHLRVFAIVVFILVIGCGTASAYSKSESMQSVVINMDGAPRMVSTDKETVGELLEDLADTIDTEFYLEDAKESDPIEAMMTLSLTSVTEKTVATTEAIAYKTVERTNSSLKAGESRVVQEGKEGVASVIKKEIYHGSELVETLYAYMQNGCSTARTALLLCLHKNTLLYRLGRIKEICENDLTSGEDLFLFHLSIRALIYLGLLETRTKPRTSDDLRAHHK